MATADQEKSGAAELEVHEVVSPGMRTLVLAGELDMSTATGLETVIVDCAESASDLTLDLSQLTFMDSTGLRLVLFAQQACEANDAEFALVRGPKQVQRVFEVTGLVDDLPFRD